MRFLFRSLTGMFLLAVTVGLLAFSGKTVFDAVQERMSQEDRRPQPRERIQAVNVHTIALENIAPILTSFGEVRSRRTLDLRASAGGTLVELADGFEEGGRVEAGQLLARIDPADAQAALLVRQTDLEEANATLAEAQRAREIAVDDLASAREQARLRDAALARANDLRERGVGTAASVENAELALSSSQQAVLSRRQALANAQSQVDRARTAVSRQEINVAEAERALASTEVYADFSGTLSGVSVVEGGLVTNNERMAQIVDTNALEVSFRVSTPQYVRLLDAAGKLSQPPVNITLDVLGVDLETTGNITRESAAVGEGQTGRLLFARLDQAQGFRPGDFVSVQVTEPVLNKVAVVPASAVGNDSSILVIGEEDRLSVQPIEVLRNQGDTVILAGDGLDGLKIVDARTPLLGAGIKVRPVDPDRAAPEQQAQQRGNGQRGGGGGGGGGGDGNGGEMVKLTEERRAKLIEFVQSNKRMPKDVRERMLTQLQEEEVPAQMVERLESRMGG